MLDWAVIADDLTGAADTGVQFLPVCRPMVLVDYRRLGRIGTESAPQGLAVFTSSRALPAGDARRRTFDTGRAVRDLRPGRVYKKIDSGLRGNIGPELEGLMAALNLPFSFIAPAFPDQGRTTAGGIHYLRGIPVAAGEMGRDPLTPVTESSLPDWIAAQTEFPAAHVGLDTLARGDDAAADAVAALLARGVRHVSFDATGPAHLDLIARLGRERFPQALLCGSAGLAQRVVAYYRPKGDVSSRPAGGASDRPNGGASIRTEGDASAINASIPCPRPNGLLFVCGSASARLRVQAERLAALCRTALATLDPEVVLQGAAAPEALEHAAAALAAGDLVLRLPAPDSRAAVDPQRLVSGLAEFVLRLAERVRLTGLFLSGGDTALAVLERLDATGVRLERELASGLGYGVLVGGLLAGRPVVTKAGSFGHPDTLVEVYRLLRPTTTP